VVREADIAEIPVAAMYGIMRVYAACGMYTYLGWTRRESKRFSQY